MQVYKEVGAKMSVTCQFLIGTVNARQEIQLMKEINVSIPHRYSKHGGNNNGNEKISSCIKVSIPYRYSNHKHEVFLFIIIICNVSIPYRYSNRSNYEYQ